ncbi:ribonuclease H-like domain-containing protein [Tanacetum coccineum]
MPELKDIVYSDDDEDVGAEADINNLDTHIPVSPILTTRIHKDHPQKTNHKDFQNCLFTCFLSQEEPKKVIQALKDPIWIEAIKEELLQFKVTQEEGIDYDKVFAPVVRIEAIRLFLAYALFKDFMVYQMDVKSAFLYEKIEEEVYVCQPQEVEDTDFLTEFYKMISFFALQWISLCTEFEKMLLKKDSPFDLVAYTNSDYAGASLDRKSTTGGCQFLGCRLISWQCKKQTVVANSTTEAEYIAASNLTLDSCGDNSLGWWVMLVGSYIQALVDGKKVIVTEASVRRDLQLAIKMSRRKQRKDAKDPQLSGPTEPVTDDTENVESVPTHSNDPLLSGEGRTPRLKWLRKVGRSARIESSEDEDLGDQEDASKQGRKIDEIDQDAEVTLVDETQGRNDGCSTADPLTTVGEVVTSANVVVSTAEVTTISARTTTVDELTMAQTLIEIKAAKPKARGAKDNGKAKMIEAEEPLKKKDQIMYDQEVALNLQAQLQVELEEEDRLARQKEEDANIAK